VRAALSLPLVAMVKAKVRHIPDIPQSFQTNPFIKLLVIFLNGFEDNSGFIKNKIC